MSVECFLIEATERVSLSLRRYRSGTRWDSALGKSVDVERGKCPLAHGYHDASTPIGEADAIWTARGDGTRTLSVRPERDTPRDDPRWPTHCACGEAFADSDEWQANQDLIYRRPDTGEVRPLREWQKVPGAMWDCSWWMPASWRGHDGRALTVICPNGSQWHIDGQATNCTLPDDREHRCWLRTGEPPRITVGKNGPGRTCGAGGGSIQAGDYHGFLVDGRFT